MRTFVGLIGLGMALMLLVGELMTLADPQAGFEMANAADIYVATSPWYVHAGWFAVIAVMGWISLRLLDRGYLGRLARGRGLTPAPERR
jgi:hypothetical protein